jgi:hypothetical protein
LRVSAAVFTRRNQNFPYTHCSLRSAIAILKISPNTLANTYKKCQKKLHEA